MARITKPTEDKLVAVRLTPDERAEIDRAVSTGVVANSSEAIRLAIRYLPRALVAKFLEEDVPELKRQVEELKRQIREKEQLGSAQEKLDEGPQPPNPMGGYAHDQLVAMAAEKPGPVKDLAQQELLRRGFFPDGLGSWVENRPDLTVRVPTAGVKRADAVARGRYPGPSAGPRPR